MKLTYPINFIGYDEGGTNGEVYTRHGEYLGKWLLIKDDEKETGTFQFFPDGETVPLFTQRIGMLDSGLLTGMALSNITGCIRDWHEDTSQA